MEHDFKVNTKLIIYYYNFIFLKLKTYNKKQFFQDKIMSPIYDLLILIIKFFFLDIWDMAQKLYQYKKLYSIYELNFHVIVKSNLT